MPKVTSVKQIASENSLILLPLNQGKLSMATIVERDKLRHNMVLPDAVEDRFRRIECEYAARDRLRAANLHYRQKNLVVRGSRLRKDFRSRALSLEYRINTYQGAI